MQVTTLPGTAVHDNHVRVPPAEISPTQSYISLSKWQLRWYSNKAIVLQFAPHPTLLLCLDADATKVETLKLTICI